MPSQRIMISIISKRKSVAMDFHLVVITVDKLTINPADTTAPVTVPLEYDMADIKKITMWDKDKKKTEFQISQD